MQPAWGRISRGGILALALLPSGAAAQAPLSAIDWLAEDRAGDIAAQPQSPLPPQIDARPLAPLAGAVGLVPPEASGLPATLWQGSEPRRLARLIADSPAARYPALRELLYALLLTEAAPPGMSDPGDRLLLARVDKLMDLGAVAPARALIEAADATASPARFARWGDAGFLLGLEDGVCAALARKPHLAPDLATRIFCLAQTGDRPGALLLFQAGLALEALDPVTAPALGRWLRAETPADRSPLASPRAPGALLFRLHGLIGEPLPTAPLPRRFAVADLGAAAGWKARIEAAERLVRTGALPAASLVELYLARRPAASGGIWARVAAVQAFQAALGSEDVAAIAATLTPVWDQMRRAGLSAAFAEIYADALARVPLPDPEAARAAFEVTLLAPEAPVLASRTAPPATGDRAGFWLALAQGHRDATPPSDALSQAVAAGFAAPLAAITSTRLGEQILQAIAGFDRGAAGNLADMTQAIALLRALGLEAEARRAAVALLVDREG